MKRRLFGVVFRAVNIVVIVSLIGNLLAPVASAAGVGEPVSDRALDHSHLSQAESKTLQKQPEDKTARPPQMGLLPVRALAQSSFSGYALDFDGGDYVNIPSDTSFDVSEFTIEAWIKLTADVGNTQRLPLAGL